MFETEKYTELISSQANNNNNNNNNKTPLFISYKIHTLKDEIKNSKTNSILYMLMNKMPPFWQE